MQRITPDCRWPLFDVAATRALEQAAAACLPPHTLMQRAGLAVARLALALAPNAKTIWIACGPGNNGGDGIEAAMHLHRWGKQVVVTWLGDEARAPADTRASLQRAREAGVAFAAEAAGAVGPGHRRPAGHRQREAAGGRDGAVGGPDERQRIARPRGGPALRPQCRHRRGPSRQGDPHLEPAVPETRPFHCRRPRRGGTSVVR